MVVGGVCGGEVVVFEMAAMEVVVVLYSRHDHPQRVVGHVEMVVSLVCSVVRICK